MSDMVNTGDKPISHDRRQIMRVAGAATLSGVATTFLASAAPVAAQQNSNDRDNGPLGARLQGAQHFGLEG